MSGSFLGLGMRPGSNRSLPQQLFTFPRKSAKMLKEKERMLRLILKFACRKKVRMLLLFVVPALLFLWLLYSGKGNASGFLFLFFKLHSSVCFAGFADLSLWNTALLNLLWELSCLNFSRK